MAVKTSLTKHDRDTSGCRGQLIRRMVRIDFEPRSPGPWTLSWSDEDSVQKCTHHSSIDSLCVRLRKILADDAGLPLNPPAG